MDTNLVADLALLVTQAKQGNRKALEALVRVVHKDVYNLAIRFFWHPQDAEDASQEILIRIITGLAGFEARSSFRTWVYRIASNTLLTLGKKRMEHIALSFDEFAEALAEGLSVDAVADKPDIAEELLLEEVKIGCTHAMLLCLDRDHRFAYILGEILDLEHEEGAEILEITPQAFRKRLSRANARITSFMTAQCGLIEPENACKCKLRINSSIAKGYVQPKNLLFAHSLPQAKQFPEVLHTIQKLETSRRVAALYRSHPQLESSTAFVSWLTRLLDEMPDPKNLPH